MKTLTLTLTVAILAAVPARADAQGGQLRPGLAGLEAAGRAAREARDRANAARILRACQRDYECIGLQAAAAGLLGLAEWARRSAASARPGTRPAPPAALGLGEDAEAVAQDTHRVIGDNLPAFFVNGPFNAVATIAIRDEDRSVNCAPTTDEARRIAEGQLLRAGLEITDQQSGSSLTIRIRMRVLAARNERGQPTGCNAVVDVVAQANQMRLTAGSAILNVGVSRGGDTLMSSDDPTWTRQVIEDRIRSQSEEIATEIRRGRQRYAHEAGEQDELR